MFAHRQQSARGVYLVSALKPMLFTIGSASELSIAREVGKSSNESTIDGPGAFEVCRQTVVHHVHQARLRPVAPERFSDCPYRQRNGVHEGDSRCHA